MRCMPWPLAVLCWLDDRWHEHHDDGPEAWRLSCRAHDRVMRVWLRLARVPGRNVRGWR